MDDWDIPDDITGAPKNELDLAEEEFLKELSRPLTHNDYPNMSQLQLDALNVQEKRVDLLSFPRPYQEQIKNYYRFSPVNVESQNSSAAQNGRSRWK